MRPEFQALLLTIPCILITAVAFGRDKRLTRVAVGDNAQLNQLLHNIRQAQQQSPGHHQSWRNLVTLQ